MTIEEIINGGGSPESIIGALKEKSIVVPSWGGAKGLKREYYPEMHPVMNKSIYPDKVNKDGTLTPVTRVTCGLQKLAVKRMTELLCGIPVKRVYHTDPDDVRQNEVANFLEDIFKKVRINSMNRERFNMLFAGCEVMTLWYAVESNTVYSETSSPLKLRCRNFSPMLGDALYPLFDESGDMVAMSVEYIRKKLKKTVTYFETYLRNRHIKWANENGWMVETDEEISIPKIPAVYMYRPTPIWEHTSNIVEEIEWSMSRNGNYLRENSRPKFVVFADEVIHYGDEPEANKAFKDVMQYPANGKAEYITWPQAVENLKYHVTELRQSFFTQLQLPDWSYESMKATPMSGESRKQLFIDAQLKVTDESGPIVEGLDREVNVAKEFAKIIRPEDAAIIDSLPVENVVTPYTISDEKDTITNLVTANGGKPVMSQLESIQRLGYSQNPKKTMEQIAEESKNDLFELSE